MAVVRNEAEVFGMMSWLANRTAVARVLATLLAMSAIFAGTERAYSQRLKEGDEIEVYFLGDWRPAVVVDTDKRGNVLAEYEFAGSQKRKAFKKSEIRWPFESGAMDRGRTWSDPSGKFKIRAALLEINEEKVLLRKEDMDELEVEISKLSTADQRYLDRLKKAMGPRAMSGPKLPDIETFAGGALGSISATFSGSDQRKALEPDPLPAYLQIKQGGVGFPLGEFFDSIGCVLPIGGEDSWLLASMQNGNPSEPLPTRILWASLTKDKIRGSQILAPGEMILDYHPPSHRLLTLSSADGKRSGWGPAVLTVWEVLPEDKAATPVVRWHAAPTSDRPSDPWARFVDGDIIVHRWGRHEIVAWSVDEKKMVYRTSQESFFSPALTVSPGHRYLFIPEDKAVRVLEAATGTLVNTLPAPDGSSGVAVSEDGRLAAVLSRNHVTVWDLTSADAEPQKYQAEAIGTPFTAYMKWVGPDRIMVENIHGLILFSLKHQLALWNYKFDMSTQRERGGKRTREIIDEHLVYAASVRSGSQRGLAVGAVKLPGPGVDQAAETLNRDELMIIKPGTAMRLTVQAGPDTQRIQDALVKKIQANGWVLDPTAQVEVLARLEIGKTQNVTYRMMGGFSGGSNQSASITPYISSIKINMGKKVIWQSASSSGAPPMVRLREGESVQNEVNRWQKPDPGFFDRVDIPARILDPDKKNGLGVTEVTNRGLIPK
jgi:hypothetical protein